MPEQYFFRVPFALEGDQQAIPEALQPTGAVSFQAGYGFDYERDPSSDPNAKDIERGKMNWLFGAITAVLRQYQTYGAFPYILSEQNNGAAFPYEKGARCVYGAENAISVYESLVSNNTALPTDATKWIRVSAADLVPKSRKIIVSGSLTGGGDLSQDVTIGVNVPASVPPARTIATAAPLTGGGDLSANRTLGINAGSAGTPNYVIQRDGAGRAQVAAPAAAEDIARKAEVDAHANLTIAHGATPAALASRIIMRDGAGRAQVAAPVAADDIARKAEVDAVRSLIAPAYELCEFYHFRHPTLKPGFQPAQGGLLYNVPSLYPKAWAYLQTAEGQKLCITEAQWQAMVNAYWHTNADGSRVGWNGIGGAPFYVVNTGNGTLRLPDLRGMYAEAAGFDSLGVGGVHGDGGRRIAGDSNYSLYRVSGYATSNGALYVGSPTRTEATSDGGWAAVSSLHLDSARVTPIAAKNQPRAWGSLACVCLDPSAS